jgi:hypothetical protein
MPDDTAPTPALGAAIRVGCSAINGHEGLPSDCDYPECDCSGIIATKAILSAAFADTPAARQVMRDAWLAECQNDTGPDECCSAMLAALRQRFLGEG